ncbi:MAG: hypothetical protein U9R15_19780 [Chloroflexota bacterium]|nr:hypothetical protein [Chloroflexota bacterium]
MSTQRRVEASELEWAILRLCAALPLAIQLDPGHVAGGSLRFNPFPPDWVDSAEGQRLLQYQSRGLGDYVQDMVEVIGYRRPLARMFRPLVRWWLLRKPPYYSRFTTGHFCPCVGRGLPTEPI